MPTRYYVTSNGISNGNRALPVDVADVTYTSISMGDNSDRVDCYVEFYDASMNPVTPTGGQVYFYGSPMPNNWVDAAESPINAASAGYPMSSYTPPYMDGLVLYTHARFVGVTGAAFASVVLYKRTAV